MISTANPTLCKTLAEHRHRHRTASLISSRQLFPENSPTPTSVSEKEQGATDEKLEPVPSDLYYDFKAENFHAEQGAPFVCTTCNGVGHLKSECPDLVVPNMIDLPAMAPEWIAILSHLCQQITGESRQLHRHVKTMLVG